MTAIDRSPASKPITRGKTPRRKLFDLHSWAGFNLAVFMTLVIFTGTFAVISDEIDWLFLPELRASGTAEQVDWAALQQAVELAAPSHVLGSLVLGESAYLTHRATLVDSYGRRYFMQLDPVTHQPTGSLGTLTVQRFLRDLHRYLFMPGALGLPLVTMMALTLLLSLYTGLKTVRNWRTVAGRIRIHKGARVAVGDYHKAVGLWSSWFTVLVVASSLWYFAEYLSYVDGSGLEPERPEPSLQSLSRASAISSMADAGTLAAAAVAAYPELQPRAIYFSVRATQAAIVLGRHADPLVRDRANRVFLDPVDASVIHVQRSPELPWSAYLNELVDPLHFGDFGGLLTKAIWFVFGLLILSLTLTGVWLTWERVKSRTPTTAQWACIPFVLVVTGFGVPYVQRHLDDQRFDYARQLPRQSVDGIDFRLSLETDASGAYSGRIALWVGQNSGRLNLAKVNVGLRRCAEGVGGAEDEGFVEPPMIMEPQLLGHHISLKGVLTAGLLRTANELGVQLVFAGEQTVCATFDLPMTEKGAITTPATPESGSKAPQNRDTVALLSLFRVNVPSAVTAEIRFTRQSFWLIR